MSRQRDGSEDGGPERAVSTRLFLFLLGVFCLLAHGYVANTDAEVELQSARAIVLRGGAGLSAAHEDASTAERLIATTPGAPVIDGKNGKKYTWFGIGHVLTLVPFWIAGRGLAALFPAAEKAVRASWEADLGPQLGRAYGEEFCSRLLVSFHSPLFGALLGAVLFALLGHLGFGVRARVLAVLAATLATQLGPETRESMATVEAAFFLLWALERALAWSRGGRAGVLVASGACAGFAVLSRLPHLLPVLGLGVWILLRAREQRTLRPVAMFVLGGLPFGVFLLWCNHARFGSPFATGYHELEGYWSFNPLYGFPLLALSPGKGMLWFSPLLWLAPWGLWKLGRARRDVALLCSWFLLSAWVLNSFTSGWHSSQAWGCRYMTAGTVLLVAVAVAALLDAQRARPVALLGALGLVVSLGGWLAPYHGFYELAFHAAAEKWPQVNEGDRIHHLVSDARMSPLHGHWIYAGLSLDGTIPDGPGERAYGALFGVPLDRAPRPAWPEDTAFRHLWPIGLSKRLDCAVPWVAGLLVLLGVLAVGLALRRRCQTLCPGNG